MMRSSFNREVTAEWYLHSEIFAIDRLALKQGIRCCVLKLFLKRAVFTDSLTIEVVSDG